MARTSTIDKRALILEAAVKTFADKGFHGTRVSDIAQEAGIAYGLIYHYFKNKEEILNAIFREKWDIFLQILRSIDRDNRDLRSKLQAIAGFFFDSYRQLPELMEVLVLEILHSSRFLEDKNLEAFQEAFHIMDAIFRQGQEQGTVAGDVDPRVASLIFLGSIETTLTGRILNTISAAYLVELRVKLVDQFLYGITGAPPTVKS
jgi:TetR/AcrR family transcriptional regulator, fatty acid metabolism regulator protein